MPGLVVGSGFPSFVGEGKVGAPIVPTIGGLVRERIDRAALRHETPLRRDLLCYFPLFDEGLKQREIAAPLSYAGGDGRSDFTWIAERLTTIGRRGNVMASAISDATNAISLGNDIFVDRPTVGTLSLWVKITSNDSVDLILFQMGATTDGILFGVTASGQAELVFAASSPFNLDIVATTSTILADGQWHHVTWTADGIAWKIYIDGISQSLSVLSGSNTGLWYNDVGVDTTYAQIVNQLIFVGAHVFGISEVASWERVLTDGEILTLAKDPDAVYVRSRRAISVDRYRIVPSGIASAEAFGNLTLVQAGLVIAPTGIPSAEAFGTPKLNQQIRFTGIPSAEAFGTPQLTQQIRFTGIPSAEAFGNLTLVSTQVLVFTGIPSAEAFGTPQLTQQIRFTGIPSAEAFGTPQLTQQIRFTGIPSAEAFGTPSLATTQFLVVVGIPSAEAFGTLTISAAGLGFVRALGFVVHIGQVDDEAEMGTKLTAQAPAGLPSDHPLRHGGVSFSSQAGGAGGKVHT